MQVSQHPAKFGDHRVGLDADFLPCESVPKDPTRYYTSLSLLNCAPSRLHVYPSLIHVLPIINTRLRSFTNKGLTRLFLSCVVVSIVRYGLRLKNPRKASVPSNDYEL